MYLLSSAQLSISWHQINIIFKEECDEINALLQMALQNAERTEDEKDRAEIIFKIARSRKGIKRWTSSYIDQGVCEKRSDQLNRRVKRITSKMMVVRKAHPTNPERIKVFHLTRIIRNPPTRARQY